MAPSAYHRFLKREEHLRELYFNSDDEVQTEVSLSFHCQVKTYYNDGVKKLISRCEKCLDSQGNFSPDYLTPLSSKPYHTSPSAATFPLLKTATWCSQSD